MSTALIVVLAGWAVAALINHALKPVDQKREDDAKKKAEV